MSSKSGRSLSSRARLAGFARSAESANSTAALSSAGEEAFAFFDAFAGFGAFTSTSTPGFSWTATAAVDAFAAPAARVFGMEGDAAVMDVSEDESGDAALRRAGRADAEDVTLSSSLCSLIGEARDHRRNGGLCGAARSKSCGPAR